MNYTPTFSDHALGQMGGLPLAALGALVETMAEVCEYPCDPLRTFPTADPYVKRASFGVFGLVTYMVDDGAWTVEITDVTWTG